MNNIYVLMKHKDYQLAIAMYSNAYKYKYIPCVTSEVGAMPLVEVEVYTVVVPDTIVHEIK